MKLPRWKEAAEQLKLSSRCFGYQTKQLMEKIQVSAQSSKQQEDFMKLYESVMSYIDKWFDFFYLIISCQNQKWLASMTSHSLTWSSWWLLSTWKRQSVWTNSMKSSVLAGRKYTKPDRILQNPPVRGGCQFSKTQRKPTWSTCLGLSDFPQCARLKCLCRENFVSDDY